MGHYSRHSSALPSQKSLLVVIARSRLGGLPGSIDQHGRHWNGPVDAPAAFLEAFKHDAAFLQVYAFWLCSSS